MSMQRCCGPVTTDSADRAQESALFKALADSHRLTILATLANAPDHVCVCDFVAGLPLNQPTVSHHLKLLRDAGLVSTERRGTWVYYRLAEDAYERIAAALQSILLPKKAAA